MVMLYDDNFYICNTCDKSLRNNCVPYQTVSNKIDVEALPKLFHSILRI